LLARDHAHCQTELEPNGQGGVMGEKGLAGSDTGAAGGSDFLTTIGDTAVTEVSAAGETLKEKLIDTGIDHGIDEGRERWQNRKGDGAPQ
jgi:hypothetical protein